MGEEVTWRGQPPHILRWEVTFTSRLVLISIFTRWYLGGSKGENNFILSWTAVELTSPCDNIIG